MNSLIKKIVVLGATSAIAQEVERLLGKDGTEFLLVARSPQRLQELQADLRVRGAGSVLTFCADLAEPAQHMAVVGFADQQFSDFDTVLLAYGTLSDQQECQHSLSAAMAELNTNFTSAAALLTLFADYLEPRGWGCIAAITSVAGDRGRRSNYVYGAAKGGLSLFLQGLRSRLHPSGVQVITIKPGPVDTPMTAQIARKSMMSSPSVVAGDICRALKRRSPEVLYTPAIWRYIMFAVRSIPEPIFKRLGGKLPHSSDTSNGSGFQPDSAISTQKSK
ncbi:MAG TPA: SDR family oxidoreductase [Terriglobales bacterium]|nr:SDR family oxidoreductase [Terriglobales bacterium]